MKSAIKLRKLIKDLMNNNTKVEEQIEEIISKTKDLEILVTLIEALGETGNQDIRSYIIDLLMNVVRGNEKIYRELKDLDAINAIVKVAEKIDDSTLRTLTIVFLHKIDSPRLTPILLRVARTLDGWDWEENGVAWDIIRSLVNIGTPAVEALIKALRHENFHVRCVAAIALGYIGDKRAVEPLIRALGDSEIRQEAANSLIMLGEYVVDPLIKTFRDRSVDTEIRKLIIEILIHIWVNRCVEDYLAGPDAIWCMDPVPDPKIAETVINSLYEEELRNHVTFLLDDLKLSPLVIKQLLSKGINHIKNPVIRDAFGGFLKSTFLKSNCEFLTTVSEYIKECDEEAKRDVLDLLEGIFRTIYKEGKLKLDRIIKHLGQCDTETIEHLRDILKNFLEKYTSATA